MQISSSSHSHKYLTYMVRRSSLAAPPPGWYPPPGWGGGWPARWVGRAVGVGGRAGRSCPAARTGGRAGGRAVGRWRGRVDGWALAGGWLVGGRLNRRRIQEGTLSKETFRNSMHQMSVCCMFFVSVWSYVSVQTRRSCLCWLLI